MTAVLESSTVDQLDQSMHGDSTLTDYIDNDVVPFGTVQTTDIPLDTLHTTIDTINTLLLATREDLHCMNIANNIEIDNNLRVELQHTKEHFSRLKLQFLHLETKHQLLLHITQPHISLDNLNSDCNIDSVNNEINAKRDTVSELHNATVEQQNQLIELITQLCTKWRTIESLAAQLNTTEQQHSTTIITQKEIITQLSTELGVLQNSLLSSTVLEQLLHSTKISIQQTIDNTNLLNEQYVNKQLQLQQYKQRIHALQEQRNTLKQTLQHNTLNTTEQQRTVQLRTNIQLLQQYSGVKVKSIGESTLSILLTPLIQFQYNVELHDSIPANTLVRTSQWILHIQYTNNTFELFDDIFVQAVEQNDTSCNTVVIQDIVLYCIQTQNLHVLCREIQYRLSQHIAVLRHIYSMNSKYKVLCSLPKQNDLTQFIATQYHTTINLKLTGAVTVIVYIRYNANTHNTYYIKSMQSPLFAGPAGKERLVNVCNTVNTWLQSDNKVMNEVQNDFMTLVNKLEQCMATPANKQTQ